jgi:broad specificity phosphatase PhoE
MKEIELRRHAARRKDADALSPEGRVQAESVGRTLRSDYAFVFVSPAQRAAETAAWFLRATRQALPPHAVVPGLTTEVEPRWREAASAAGSSRIDAVRLEDPELVEAESKRLAGVVEEMFARVPDAGRALAVGHTPLIEAAALGLTGVVIDPLRECEGITVVREGEAAYRIEEMRLNE